MQILTEAITAINSNSKKTFDVSRLADAFGISKTKFTNYTWAKGYLPLCNTSDSLTGEDIIFLAYTITQTRVKWANKKAIAKCLTKSVFKQIIADTESYDGDEDIVNPNSFEARLANSIIETKENRLKLDENAILINKAHARIDTLTDRVNILELDNANLKLDNDKFKLDNTNLKSRIHHHDEEIGELRLNNQKLHDTVAKQSARINTLESTVAKLAEVVESVKMLYKVGTTKLKELVVTSVGDTYKPHAERKANNIVEQEDAIIDAI